ncbi:MAG TPA: hypothetical protein VJ902_09655 [Wenzhouxiangellaceae bacterium]|nr:hypothetical protein [Wenzhouxiangellaceae bacterium]
MTRVNNKLAALIGAATMACAANAWADDNRWIVQFAPGAAGNGAAAVHAAGGRKDH